VATAGARVVAVPVSNYRAVDGAPGVDVEITRGAIQPFGTGNDEIHGRRFREWENPRETRRDWVWFL
jgi:hypothetical protein